MSSPFNKPPGPLVLLLVGVALLLLLVLLPDDHAAPVQPFAPDVSPPLLSIDAREIAPEGIVDLAQFAAANGCSTDPDDLFLGAQPVRVLEVLDTHVLRLETMRGEEIVALDGVLGTTPALPEEINVYIREVAVPELASFLADGSELYEMRRHTAGILWEFPDPEGRRVVDLQRAGPDGGAQSIGAEIVNRGWGSAMPNGLSTEQLQPYMFLGPPDLPSRGLRALPASEALQASFDEGFETVFGLTNAQLTQRALGVQASLATQLEWAPEEPVRVEWVSPATYRELHLARARSLRQTLEEGAVLWTDEQLEQQADDAQQETVAWSPEGPVIQLVRRRWALFGSLDLLDELLAHELVHQYQEEVLRVHDEGGLSSEQLGSLLEGHAGHLTQRWLDGRAPGAAHIPHAQAVREFDALLTLTGDTPDALVRRFQDGEWTGQHSSFCNGLMVLPGEPVQRQPVVEVVAGGDRPVLRLGNPGGTPLAGLYSGRWCAPPADDVFSPLGHWAEKTSPPFHVVLPPGTSVQVRLTLPVDGAVPGASVSGNWSPTPSLVSLER